MRFDVMPRVVRGGGETRRRIAVAFALPLITALTLAMPASAATELTVKDGTGDVFVMWNALTGEPTHLFPASTPIAKAGYFDMKWVALSQDGDTYTFVMELVKALPTEGAPLVKGVRLAEWAMWIDPAPWNPILSPVAPLARIALSYDGSEYSASVLVQSTMEEVPTESFSHDGSTVVLVFSAESIGNLQFSWWDPLVRVYLGPRWSAGSLFVDSIDYDATNGQIYGDLPWPPPLPP